MKFHIHIRLLMIWTVILIPILLAQDIDRKQQQNRLQQIRKDIEAYRRKVRSEQQKEVQLLDALSQLDREIDLINQLLTELGKEDKRKSSQINNISRDLESKRDELKRLQEIYAKRIVSFYKYGRMKDIELLLSAKSFNQTLTWFKFQKLIAKNDQRNYLNILKKKQQIEAQRNKLKQEVITHRKIIKEKQEEEERLKSNRTERNQLLTQVQQNKDIYFNKIKEYELSAREIQRLINLEENKRLTLEEKGVIQSTDFPNLKGRMIWPTRGEIITHFGRFKHPKWKTITESIGIDIQANFGQDVRATSKGIVTAITWQRGRGNIIIINHLGGYFTVYTHLSQIFIQVDESVEEGQVIGSIGDSGSMRGPMLHFEIWKNNQVLDPEEWLS